MTTCFCGLCVCACVYDGTNQENNKTVLQWLNIPKKNMVECFRLVPLNFNFFNKHSTRYKDCNNNSGTFARTETISLKLSFSFSYCFLNYSQYNPTKTSYYLFSMVFVHFEILFFSITTHKCNFITYLAYHYSL